MKNRVAINDSFELSTKEYTPDGFLKGRARAMIPGIAEYDAADIGVGPRGKTVKVHHTPESVFHPDTKASANGAAMTLKHPAVFVTPDTWRSVAVGNVTGDADEDKDENGGLSVPFILGDRRAIEQADKGSQVSVGKWMRLEKAPEDSGADYETIGPIEINHLALVAKSRTGPETRVMDSATDIPEDGETAPQIIQTEKAPTAGNTVINVYGGKEKMETSNVKPTTEKENPMFTDEMKKQIDDTVTASIEKALKGSLTSQNTEIDADTLKNTVAQTVTPIAEKVESLAKQVADERTRAEEANTAQLRKQSEQKAIDSANKLVEKTIKEERARNHVMSEALPFIPEQEREQYRESSIKEVLVRALKDVIPNAASMTEDFLRGSLTTAKAIMKAAPTTTVPMNPTTMLPATDSWSKMVQANGQMVLGPPPPEDGCLRSRNRTNTHHGQFG